MHLSEWVSYLIILAQYEFDFFPFAFLNVLDILYLLPSILHFNIIYYDARLSLIGWTTLIPHQIHILLEVEPPLLEYGLRPRLLIDSQAA
jgi:hypothetical protein